MTTSQSFDLTAIAKQAMLDKGFIPDFPAEALQELNKIAAPQMPIKNVNARDMRNLLWFSIDNDDSRDLDQLTYAETVEQNKYKIYIAVADVDLLVKKNSAIDIRAAHNTTSVYTPTKVFAMLPEKLSTDLTSLNPNSDRLALIFEGVLGSGGCLESQAIYLGYVHNYAKLAYDGISDWLDGKSHQPPIVGTVPGLEQQLRLQDAIAKKIAQCRHEHGALTFETIEPKSILANGIPVDIKEQPKNRGRLLIENFMIIANSISAKYSEENQLTFLRRVVTIPKRWDKIIDIANEFGEKLPATPDAVALEKFLVKQKQANPVKFPDLSLTIIKLLGRGEYHVYTPGKQSPGHFGLALREYTHSTAPNRRFPDLITQRIILSVLANQPRPYSDDELTVLAVHCTEKEDDAEKVERRTLKSAAALVLSSRIGKTFYAIVTGAGEKGTWVRIVNPPVEGKLVKGAENADVGDSIRVKLVHTDVLQGYIDFVRA